jgi:hypothetical protein
MSRELTESDIFVLLANRRRRLALRVLRESSTPLPAGELSDRIAKREYEEPTVNDRRSIYLSLYHDHLPRLDEAGVAVYDEDEGSVAPGLNFDSITRALREVNRQDLPWSDE